MTIIYTEMAVTGHVVGIYGKIGTFFKSDSAFSFHRKAAESEVAE